jgi:hypothetical protein
MNTHILRSFVLLLSIAVFVLLAPLEKTLGANARLVYFHGAWVWVALLAFGIAGLIGLAGLIRGNLNLHAWSRALGWSALIFWLGFLPMSLILMQANWNGLFLDEPRFRIPLNLAIVGLLLQLGLLWLPVIPWTSLGNLLFSGIVWFVMRDLETVLHPDSPILRSDSRNIQLFFVGLVLLLSLLALDVARRLKRPIAQPGQAQT